jgi:uncharacterized protein (UPF0335 family)
MAKSQLVQFINKIQSDEALRRKVEAAERSAEGAAAKVMREIVALRHANLDPIKKIAMEAGFDIDKDIGRPEIDLKPHDHEKEDLGNCCHLTCCWVETSVARRI